VNIRTLKQWKRQIKKYTGQDAAVMKCGRQAYFQMRKDLKMKNKKEFEKAIGLKIIICASNYKYDFALHLLPQSNISKRIKA